MAGSREILLLVLVLYASPSLAGKTAPWKAEAHPAAGTKDQIPSYCGSLAALIQKRLAKLRALHAEIRQQDSAPSTSVLQFSEKLMGNSSYKTDAQKEQIATLAKGKAEAVELNERYKGQKCGSIDIEHEIDRAPDPAPVTPLKSHQKKLKL